MGLLRAIFVTGGVSMVTLLGFAIVVRFVSWLDG